MNIDNIITDINKRRKYKIITKGIVDREYAKIPFTSERLNYMTYGGIPRGCITEFAGIESSGKTTTALDIVKNAQILFRNEYNERLSKAKDEADRRNIEAEGQLQVVYADCENTLDEGWARLLGVDIENLYILSPQQDTAETIFDILIELLESGKVGLLVIDSLGVMVSAQAFEKSIEQKTYGGIAMALTTFSKRAVMLCQKYLTTIIGINQIREDIGNPYGGFVTTGGRGWKHNCTLRLMFNKGSYIDENNNAISKSSAVSPYGNVVEVAIEKTKSCKPDRRRGSYILNYSYGINYVSDLIELGLALDIITQKGAYYYFYEEDNSIAKHNGNDLIFQGKNNLFKYLVDNVDFMDELRANIATIY